MGKLNKKMKQKTQSGGGGGGNKQAMQFNHALGQHILKNPLVIQALRQHYGTQTPSLRSAPAQAT